MAKIKGCPVEALPIYLMILIGLLSGLLSAGPVQRPDESAAPTHNDKSSGGFSIVTFSDPHTFLTLASPGTLPTTAVHPYVPDPQFSVPCHASGLSDAVQICVVKADSVYDYASGVILGKLNDAIFHPNGTLEYGPPSMDSVERRSPALEKRHNWALVCHNDRSTTNLCAGSPYKYSCNGFGKLIQYGPQSLQLCTDLCICVNLNPKSYCIGLTALGAFSCHVVEDTVFDDAGAVVGKLAGATILSNGTLDFASPPPTVGNLTYATSHSNERLNSTSLASIEKGNTELVERHNYAIVCLDKVFTQYCRSSPYGYSCLQNARVIFSGAREATCDYWCSCVNIAPAIVPVPCIKSTYRFISDCKLVEDTVFGDDGTIVGKLEDATVHPNGTLDFNSRAPIEKRNTDLVKRHDYAVSCENDRLLTEFCIGAPYKYSCDSRGQLTCHGQGFQICLEFCTCVNLNPRPKCIVAPLIIDCHVVKGTIYDNNGTVLAKLSDAVVHPNGTYELQTHAAIEKRETDLTTPNYVLSCKIASGTTLCSGQPSFYACSSNGRVIVKGPASEFCDMDCNCSKDSNSNGDSNPKTPLLPSIGKPSPAPTIPATVITIVPLSAPTTAERLTIQDLVFGCESTNGILKPALSYDDGLTNSCKRSGYSCYQATDDSPVWTMVHPSPPIASCESSCFCAGQRPKMAARDINNAAEAMKATVPVTTKVTAVATTTESNTLDFSSPTKAPAIDVVERADVIVDITHPGMPAKAFLPENSPFPHPHRNCTYPTNSTQFVLGCGNRREGAALCASAGLGFFCTANQTLCRHNTTANTPDSAWCSTSCSCLFASEVPCLNKWNIPLCREFPDGTVRDARDLKQVLSYVSDTIVFANGTLQIPETQGGLFPFPAAEPVSLPNGGGGIAWNVTTARNTTGRASGDGVCPLGDVKPCNGF